MYTNNWSLHKQNDREGLIPRPEYATHARTSTELMNLPEDGMYSGYEALDERTGGLKPHKLTLFVGIPSSGKTTVITQAILSGIEQDCVVEVSSGHTGPRDLYKRILTQAAGPEYVEKLFNPDYAVRKAVEKWMFRRLFIQEADSAGNLETVLWHIGEDLKDTHADLVVIDSPIPAYEAEDGRTAIQAIRKFADENRVHVICATSAKKSGPILRPGEIDEDMLANADNVILVHRCGKFFDAAVNDTFKNVEHSDDISNYLEIIKADGYETESDLVPLYYDPKSKRMLEAKGEKLHYSWESR